MKKILLKKKKFKNKSIKVIRVYPLKKNSPMKVMTSS